MQRFGLNSLMIFLVIVVGTSTSCTTNVYHDDDMARLATLARTTMSIVKGEYYGKTIPAQLDENRIIEIVRTQNSPNFKELDQLDGPTELMIVSDGAYMGAIIWDSGNDRKLIQDLQCTTKLDDATYQREEFGHTFALNFETCPVY